MLHLDYQIGANFRIQVRREKRRRSITGESIPTLFQNHHSQPIVSLILKSAIESNAVTLKSQMELARTT